MLGVYVDEEEEKAGMTTAEETDFPYLYVLNEEEEEEEEVRKYLRRAKTKDISVVGCIRYEFKWSVGIVQSQQGSTLRLLKIVIMKVLSNATL